MCRPAIRRNRYPTRKFTHGDLMPMGYERLHTQSPEAFWADPAFIFLRNCLPSFFAGRPAAVQSLFAACPLVHRPLAAPLDLALERFSCEYSPLASSEALRNSWWTLWAHGMDGWLSAFFDRVPVLCLLPPPVLLACYRFPGPLPCVLRVLARSRPAGPDPSLGPAGARPERLQAAALAGVPGRHRVGI